MELRVRSRFGVIHECPQQVTVGVDDSDMIDQAKFPGTVGS